MIEFLAKRTLGGLIPIDAHNGILMEDLPMGKEIRVKCTVARSNPQSRWFEKCITEIFKHQDTWPTRNMFRNKIKEALGYFVEYEIKGKREIEYRSFAFDKMDQNTFNGVCDRFCKLVSERIIPHMSNEETWSMFRLLDADTGVLGNRIAA